MSTNRNALCIGLSLALLSLAPAAAPAQVEESPDGALEHPAAALCRVCSLRGSTHGPEKVAAHREYRDRHYYFCASACAEAFDAFPEGYAIHPLPRPAPDAIVLTEEGEALALGDLRGRPLLLDFWATWCKPCTATMPALSKLKDTYGDRLSVVGVSIDEKGPEHVAKFLQKHPVRYDIAMDTGESPAWHAYAVAAIPAAFLIDAEGQIVEEWRGGVDPEIVAERVQALIGADAAR